MWGYSEKLEILANRAHPRYEEEVADWMSLRFDPSKFDLNAVNQEIKRMAAFWKSAKRTR